MDSSFNNKALLQAVKEGNLEESKKIILRDGYVAGDDWIDYTLLIMALQRDHRDLAHLLLQMGCRVNQVPKNNFNHSPLYYAVALNDIKLVKELLDRGASIYDEKDGEETPLCLAMRNKQFEIVDRILTIILYTCENIDPTNNNDIRHFLIACERNKSKLIKKFVKYGISVNSFVSFDSFCFPGYTPLHFAVNNVNVETVKFLVSHGADCSATTSDGWTALHFANQIRDLIIDNSKITRNLRLTSIHTIIDTILCANNFNFKLDVNYIGISHFHIACTRGNTSIIGRFLQFGVDINQSVPLHFDIYGGFTSLHFAVYNNCQKAIDLLLDYGAEINAKNKEGWTPLNFAVASGDENLVELLLKRGADVCTKCIQGLTPLHYAFLKAKRNMIDMLLIHSPKHNNLTYQGLSHFHIACTRNNLNVVESFLKNNVSVDAKVDINSMHFPGYSALHFAIEFSQIAVIKLLLQHQAMINTKEAKNLTPLHLACMQNFTKLSEEIKNPSLEKIKNWTHNCANQVEIVKLLLNYHADVNAKDCNNATPLYYAFGNETTKEKLRRWLIFEYRNSVESTIISKLVISQKEIIELLIAKDADVNAKQIKGRTPLHNASLLINYTHYQSAFKSLLKADCNVNAQDNRGRTALHIAALSKNINAVFELLKYGADINIEDNNGETVLCSMHLDDTSNLYTFNIIQDHLKKIIALGFHVSDKVKSSYIKVRNRYGIVTYDFMNSDDDSDTEDEDYDCDLELAHDDFANKCRMELEKMKNVKLNRYCTLYNILYKDSGEMATYIKNNRFKKFLSSDNFDKDFPIYGDLLKLQFKKGTVRSNLLSSGKVSLSFITGVGLPDVCSEQILKYLSNDNLKNLIKAMHSIEPVKRKLPTNSIEDFEPLVKYLRLEQ